MSNLERVRFNIISSELFDSITPGYNFYRVENDDNTEDIYFKNLKLNNEDYGETFDNIDKQFDNNEQNILALMVAVTILQQAQVDGTADNIAVETFETQSGFTILSGHYDSTNHMLYA